MAGWKITMFNRKYIFIHSRFSVAVVMLICWGALGCFRKLLYKWVISYNLPIKSYKWGFIGVKITHWSYVNRWSGHFLAGTPALPSPTDGYAIVQRPGTKQNVPEASEVPTEVPEEDRGEDRGEMLMLIYSTNVPMWHGNPQFWFLRLITPTFWPENFYFS